MKIYRYEDYKDFLKFKIRENAAVYGYKSQLAQAAGCQNSFLSQVLKSHVHLTPEHAFGLAEFWSLQGEERDFFMDLVGFARASTPAMRSYLKSRLQALKRQSEAKTLQYSDDNVTNEWLSMFYASWHYSAVHIILTIPEYRTVRAIATRLQLAESLVQSSLSTLEEMKLVENRGDHWIATTTRLSSPKGTHYGEIHHANWSSRAVQDTFRKLPSSVHYTTVFSMSQEDYQRLRDLAIQMVDKANKMITPSKEEELFCLNLDLFRV